MGESQERRMGSVENAAPTKNFRRRGSNEAPARIPRRGSNESTSPRSGFRRKLPPRQGTFDTAASAGSLLSTGFEDEREKLWAEERLELLEKIEALESKLQSKEAVMKSLLLTAAENTNSCAATCTSSLNSNPYYPVGPVASLVLEKEKELAQLEATVRHQAIHLEQMEVDQEQAVYALAEELFHEWQQEESQGVSLWEQWQEQKERIATLQAENEHVKQLHRAQSRQTHRLIDRFLAEKKQRAEQEEEEGTQQQQPQPRRSSLPDLVPCTAAAAVDASSQAAEEGETPSTEETPSIEAEEPIYDAAPQQPDSVALGYGVPEEDQEDVAPQPTRRCSMGDDTSSSPRPKAARRLSTDSTMSSSASDRTMTKVLLEETRRVKTRLRRLSTNGGGGGGMDGSASSRSSTISTVACSSLNS